MEEVTVVGAPTMLLGVSSGTAREIGVVRDDVRVAGDNGRDGGMRLDRLLDRRMVHGDGGVRRAALRAHVRSSGTRDMGGSSLDTRMRRDERGDGRM